MTKDTHSSKGNKNKAESTKKPVEATKVQKKAETEFSHAIAFWGFAILLFLPPYFRGLFFQPEQERALIFAAVIFWLAWLWKWSKRDNSFLSHPLDYFVLAFPVIYLVSAFQAANYGLAVDEVVKTTLYFMVYWISSKLVRDEKDIVTILQVIYISAIGVALAGLATASGVINIKDGFLNGRIYSTFQYPNALASYLAAVIFMGFYLWRRSQPKVTVSGTKSKDIPAWLNFSGINQYLYAMGNFLLFAVLIGSKSQGGLLVFLIVFILFIIGLPKGNRIPVIIHFILVSIPSFLAIWQFLSAVAANKMDLAWLWILAGLALAIAGQALYGFSERKGLLHWLAEHRNIVLAVILLVVISGCVGAGVYSSANSDTVKNLTEEIRFRSVTERMYFFQDAMKMFQERPIIGWGGGGWQEAYRNYQSYLYDSNQVHGHYFQIMVETGILGLLVIIGMWVSFLYINHRLYYKNKDNPANRFLIWTITIAAISMGLHAVIDFDLSLSALALVLWTMFGLSRGIGIYSGARAEEKKRKKYVPPNYHLLAGITVVSIVIILLAGSLVQAGNYAVQAGAYLHKQNLGQGADLLQKASAYNPFNADYHSNMARIYQQQGKFDEGIIEAQKAIELSNYSAQRYADLAGLYFNGKKSSEDAVANAEKALSLAPYQIRWYELLARTYFATGINELSSGNKDAAKPYFEKLLKVPAMVEERMAGLTQEEKRLWNVAPHLTSTPAISLNVGVAQYFLGDWQLAESNLEKAAVDDSAKGEALLWLSILKSKQGKELEAKDLSQQALTLAPHYKEQYEGIKQLPLLVGDIN